MINPRYYFFLQIPSTSPNYSPIATSSCALATSAAPTIRSIYRKKFENVKRRSSGSKSKKIEKVKLTKNEK